MAAASAINAPDVAMVVDGGTVAATAPAAPLSSTVAQPVLMAQAAQLLQQESLDGVDSTLSRNREQNAGTGIPADEATGPAATPDIAMAQAAPASVDELRSLPQQARADASFKVLEDERRQIPQQQASAQLMAAMQPEEQVLNTLPVEVQPTRMEKAMKSVAESPGRRPAGTGEISNGQSDGFDQYGAPIMPAADGAVSAKVVDKPVFRNEGGTLAGAELSADVAAAQDREEAKPPTVIRAFAGGWGKGSGAGAGGSVAKDELSGWTEKQKSDKKLALNQPKEAALLGEREARTGDVQRSTVAAEHALQNPARGAGGKLNDGRILGADADAKSTTGTRGNLGLDRGRAVELAKERPETKSDSTPMPGYLSMSGSFFRPEKDHLLSFQAEIPTAKQPFSTFSLHVSDVSFQLAKDALTKGIMPDPARIRPEEFYNAFDYNDPSPAPGEEVACRIEQANHPFLQQRDLVRIALKVAAAGRAAGQPLRLTLLLDTSGSMEREDRAISVRRALETLATLLGPQDRVTLIGFARTPRLLAEQVPGDQAGKLVEIAARTPSEGGTNLEEALTLASAMALKQKLPAAQNRIVLLTDGAANLGNASPVRLARQIE
ncbi:MAG: von Willebrand factor type A domain-containing protein, partial [Verrucomicrobiota bacterium]